MNDDAGPAEGGALALQAATMYQQAARFYFIAMLLPRYWLISRYVAECLKPAHEALLACT